MKKRTATCTGNGAGIGAGLGLLGDLFIQLSAMQASGQPLSWQQFKDQYDLQQALRHVLIGAGVGAGIGLVYALLVEEDEEVSVEAFAQNAFLKALLINTKGDPKSRQAKADQKVVEKVSRFLSARFADVLLDAPQLTGSTARRTAIHPTSDYDMALVFRPEAGTHEALREMVHNALTEKFTGRGCTIRLQNHTVGLLMERHDGTTLKMDVMPAKGWSDYLVSGNMSIWSRKRDRVLKTNVRKHNQLPVNMPQARDSIKLLKLYKGANGLPLPTPLISQVIPSLMRKRGGYSSLAGNLRFSIAGVANKLSNLTVRDVANGGNDLCGTLNETDKQQLRETLLDDLERWKTNPHHLKTMFAGS